MDERRLLCVLALPAFAAVIAATPSTLAGRPTSPALAV